MAAGRPCRQDMSSSRDAPPGAAHVAHALPLGGEGVFDPRPRRLHAGGPGAQPKEGYVPTERKIRLVEELKQLISEAHIAIATSYQGIPVADQTVLRTAMREAGLRFRVVKNNLLLRAADEAGLEVFKQLADGPTALVVGTEEPVTASRVIATYIKEHPDTKVAIRNAVLDGKIVDAAHIYDLATIPPRDELLARIAGGLVGQVREFAGLIQATTRNFSGLIEARAKQLEAEGGQAA